MSISGKLVFGEPELHRRTQNVGIDNHACLCAFWRKAMLPRLDHFLLLLVLLATLVPPSRGWAQLPPKPSIQAVRLQGSIEIDGRFDEADWARAQVGSEFIERVPVPLREPAARTEFRVLFDSSNVYVGVTCYFIPGEELEPRALEMRLDSFRIYRDDALTLKFDVRHDLRTTIGFGTNPAGAMVDYIALDNGKVFRREYDMVWEVETQVTDTYWTAEYRIPVAALGLSPKEGERILGFNVTRDHNARLATYDWAHLPPEFGATAALYYGQLEGLEGMGGGLPITVLPYVLGSVEGDGSYDGTAKAGGEVRLNIADNVWTELTILTDFAEVDLDDPAVNLTRFPLFFPERRPFFLSGLELYDFGEVATSQLFFSRRIGLDPDGNAIPIIGGLKAYGRRGPVEFGALQVFTAREGEFQSGSWSVARARYNVTDTAKVGVMTTLRGFLTDPVRNEGFYTPNIGIGIDGDVRLSKRLELSAFWSGTIDETAQPEDRTTGHSARALIRYRGYFVQPTVSALLVTEDFRPAVGFVRRTDILSTRVDLPWIYRTTAGGLSKITTTAYAELITDVALETNLDKRFTSSFEVDWQNGWHFEVNGDVIEEFVNEPFELFDGVTVDAGRYKGLRLRTGFDTPFGRNPSASFYYSGGNQFYGGDIHSFSGDVEAGLGRHVRVSANGAYSMIFLPALDRRDVLTGSANLVVTPTNRLSVEANAQINNVEESGIGLLRVRWRYLPGSDVFFVYREDFSYGSGFSSERSFTLKLNYRLEAVL